MKIAFLILAHRQIELVYKQIEMLDNVNHYFYVHLDRKYNPRIDAVYQRKPNVVFLKNRFNVSWGGFSTIKATVELLRSAFNYRGILDYFVLLSGQCFPVKSHRVISNFFKRNDGTIYIEANPLPDNSLADGGLDKFYYPVFFDQMGILRIEYKKIMFRFLKRILKAVKYKRKFPGNFRPCFGSQWWAIPRTAAEYILTFINKETDIVKFFKYTWAPDELFFHTILYNSQFRDKIINQLLWFIDWNTNGPPKILTSEDLGALLKSNKLFARKFDLVKSSQLLRQLEKYCAYDTN